MEASGDAGLVRDTFEVFGVESFGEIASNDFDLVFEIGDMRELFNGSRLSLAF